MSLHYIGQLKAQICYEENVKKCINFYMHPFNVTRLLTYYFLTYYSNFWFTLNFL